MTKDRVAFIVSDTADKWIGGLNYIANLIRAIQTNPERTIEPVIVVPHNAPASLEAMFGDTVLLRSRLVSGRHPLRILGYLAKRFLGRNLALERFLRKNDISAISHSPSLGARSRVPSITWAPDFQHRRLPQFFSQEECALRDARMRKDIETASVVVLSSFAAREDLRNFMPEALAKTEVLHFASSLGGGTEYLATPDLERIYNFSGPYFHLPNQFWKHKNHAVVIEAVRALRSRGLAPLVICTGSTADYRNAEHFASLTSLIEQYGISDNFRILGIVPYAHLRSLMRSSIAVINPSEFEGWSTTVEEARSLGKTIIISDIDVHREQAPTRGLYFDPASHDELADLMSSTLQNYDVQTDLLSASEADTEMRDRFLNFGKKYEVIVSRALERSRGGR